VKGEKWGGEGADPVDGPTEKPNRPTNRTTEKPNRPTEHFALSWSITIFLGGWFVVLRSRVWSFLLGEA
jgi:hypothetical protein